jgi:hypothetical protein
LQPIDRLMCHSDEIVDDGLNVETAVYQIDG